MVPEQLEFPTLSTIKEGLQKYFSKQSVPCNHLAQSNEMW